MNKLYLSQIVEMLTFIATSGDTSFIENTEVYAKNIEKNFEWIKNNNPNESKISVNQADHAFKLYFESAINLALHMSKNPNVDYDVETDVVFKQYKDVSETFDRLHESIKSDIDQNSVQTNKHMSFILNYLGTAGILLYIVVFLISISIYYQMEKYYRKLISDVVSYKNDRSMGQNGVKDFDNEAFCEISNQLRDVVGIIDELEQQKSLIEEQSKKDHLTNLYNRQYVDEMINAYHTQFLNKGIIYGIIEIDLDHFKTINDTYGHPSGDAVLISVARILKNMTRSSDIIGRWGGEEFLIVLQGVNPQQLYDLAEKIRIAFENTILNDVGSITASFGGSCIAPHLTKNTFIKIVDDALYEAKKTRNTVVIT